MVLPSGENRAMVVKLARSKVLHQAEDSAIHERYHEQFLAPIEQDALAIGGDAELGDVAAAAVGFGAPDGWFARLDAPLHHDIVTAGANELIIAGELKRGEAVLVGLGSGAAVRRSPSSKGESTCRRCRWRKFRRPG